MGDQLSNVSHGLPTDPAEELVSFLLIISFSSHWLFQTKLRATARKVETYQGPVQASIAKTFDLHFGLCYLKYVFWQDGS